MEEHNHTAYMVYRDARRVSEETVTVHYAFMFPESITPILCTVVLSTEDTIEDIEKALNEALHCACVVFYHKPDKHNG